MHFLTVLHKAKPPACRQRPSRLAYQICALASLVFSGTSPLAESFSSADSSDTQLIICVEKSPEVLDPAPAFSITDNAIIHGNIYETLFKIDRGKLLPHLALSWEEITQDQQYRIKLRSNVAFHPLNDFKPSRLMNAYDVEFSLNRLRNTPIVMFNFKKGAEIKVLDSHTIEIFTPKPIPQLLHKLATQETSIVSAEHAENNGELSPRSPLSGTGPYRIADSVPGERLSLRRFDSYWSKQQLPSITAYTIKTVSNPLERFTAVRLNKCQISTGFSSMLAGAAKAIDHLQALPSGGNNTALLVFNNRAEPTHSLLFRQAAAYAIDRDRILKRLDEPFLYKAKTLIPPGIRDQSNIDPIPIDPALAKNIFSTMLPHQKSVRLDYSVQNDSVFPRPLRIAEMIAEDLEKAGLEVDLVMHEDVQTLVESMYEDTMQISIVAWFSSAPTARKYVAPILSCNKSNLSVKTSAARWCNSEYQAWAKKYPDLSSPARDGELMLLLNREIPILPLWHSQEFDIVAEDIGGYSRAHQTRLDLIHYLDE